MTKKVATRQKTKRKNKIGSFFDINGEHCGKTKNFPEWILHFEILSESIKNEFLDKDEINFQKLDFMKKQIQIVLDTQGYDETESDSDDHSVKDVDNFL